MDPWSFSPPTGERASLRRECRNSPFSSTLKSAAARERAFSVAASSCRETFECLDLAYAAGKRGGLFPACLSAANEVAVERFLQNRLAFLGIPRVVREVLEAAPSHLPPKPDELLSLEVRGSTRNLALEGHGTERTKASFSLSELFSCAAGRGRSRQVGEEDGGFDSRKFELT